MRTQNSFFNLLGAHTKFKTATKNECNTTARSFAADRKGGVAVIFSLAALPMLAMMSISIDYSRSLELRAHVQKQLDGAVLAASSDSSGGDRTAIARKYFLASMATRSSAIKSTNFVFDATTGQLTGDTVATQAMMIGQSWGKTLDVSAHATAMIASVKVRALDVVMCIDATGSMGNTLAAVQTNALNFKSNLEAELKKQGVPAFEQVRVRTIYFRDFGGYGFYNAFYGYSFTGTALGDSSPLLASSFMTLPADNNAFSSFVSSQSASGGGDLPESGLECLNEAMRSTWTKVDDVLPGGKKVEEAYPVISIYTDAGARPPNFTWSLQNPSYPSASVMPRDYAGLLARWNGNAIDQKNKMILFYGDPDKSDDGYFHLESGWKTVKTWSGFSNPGSLTSANLSFVSTLAKGISSKYSQPTLTH